MLDHALCAVPSPGESASSGGSESARDDRSDVESDGGETDESNGPAFHIDTGPSCVRCGTKEEHNPTKGDMLLCDGKDPGSNDLCNAGQSFMHASLLPPLIVHLRSTAFPHSDGWHMGCLDPPLASRPRGAWYCPEHAAPSDQLIASCPVGCTCPLHGLPPPQRRRRT